MLPLLMKKTVQRNRLMHRLSRKSNLKRKQRTKKSREKLRSSKLLLKRLLRKTIKLVLMKLKLKLLSLRRPLRYSKTTYQWTAKMQRKRKNRHVVAALKTDE